MYLVCPFIFYLDVDVVLRGVNYIFGAMVELPACCWICHQRASSLNRSAPGIKGAVVVE